MQGNDNGRKDLEDLLVKDPLDKTRECTIQEMMNMMMNLQEMVFKDQTALEKRYQMILKA